MEKNLNRTVKQAERDRMRVDGKLQALRGDGNKEWIDFEDLGVDMLFIDEAHQYKNLAIATTKMCIRDRARTESNTRLLQMLVESGRLSQNTIDLCCWNQTDSRLAASMLPKASDHLLVRLSGRDWCCLLYTSRCV